MSKVRLPKPLPYDYVDELIDEKYEFTLVQGFFGDVIKCYAKTGWTGNVVRPFMSVYDDVLDSEVNRLDKDGYLSGWVGGTDCMHYNVSEPVEKALYRFELLA